VAPDELLERVAANLRHQIGPAVGEPFATTQAYMAAVILEKLSGQLRTAGLHAEADRAAYEALVEDLRAEPGGTAPAGLATALAMAAAASPGADGSGVQQSLGELVTALYEARDELGSERFDTLLARVRATLRARLDRQLEYSRE
jgi:hypothetical protein